MADEDQDETVTLTKAELEALQKQSAASRETKIELMALRTGLDLGNPTTKLVLAHELPDDFTEETFKTLGEKYSLFLTEQPELPDENEKLGDSPGEEERAKLRAKSEPDEPPEAPEKSVEDVAQETWNASIIDTGHTETLARVLHSVMTQGAELERKAEANLAYHERQQRREAESR